MSTLLMLVTAAVLRPPVRNGIAAELARLCARVQMHVPLVARQVIQPVRNQLALACAGKVIIKRLHLRLRLRLRMGLALAGEVADQLLFLRVDAQHRLAPGQIPSLEPGDVFELSVSVGMPHKQKMPKFTAPNPVRALARC